MTLKYSTTAFATGWFLAISLLMITSSSVNANTNTDFKMSDARVLTDNEIDDYEKKYKSLDNVVQRSAKELEQFISSLELNEDSKRKIKEAFINLITKKRDRINHTLLFTPDQFNPYYSKHFEIGFPNNIREQYNNIVSQHRVKDKKVGDLAYDINYYKKEIDYIQRHSDKHTAEKDKKRIQTYLKKISINEQSIKDLERLDTSSQELMLVTTFEQWVENYNAK